jgi:hypothetical protein
MYILAHLKENVTFKKTPHVKDVFFLVDHTHITQTWSLFANLLL